MRSLVLAALAGLLGAPLAAGAQTAAKVTAEPRRNLHLEVVVDAPPDRAFELWTTEAGVKQFFAPAARVDGRPGGRYEIIFAPKQDPEGASAGTKGSKIFRFEPGRLVAFQWGMPPFDSQLNVPKGGNLGQTWVEVAFARDREPGKTRVVLTHFNFGGSEWDRSFAWFGDTWGDVLERFEVLCRTGTPVDWTRMDQRTSS